MSATKTNTVVLVVLDGWGIAQPSVGNAITQTKLPHIEAVLQDYPVYSLQASGESVGLPWGEQGNSEVGHLSLGSGRIVYQDLPRITKSIVDGEFIQNTAFSQAFNHAKLHNSNVHLIGLVSDGGVHSYNEHLYALLEMAKLQEVSKTFVHAILDGRDTPKDSAKQYIAELQKTIHSLQWGSIATLSGRFYAMDRDKHWERTSVAYQAIVNGVSKNTSPDPLIAIDESYRRGVFDEELYPTVMQKNGKPVTVINNNDVVIFFNYRPDRIRQLTQSLVLGDFDAFVTSRLQNVFVVTMTEYEKNLPVQIAYPPHMIGNPLAKVLSDNNLQQLHIAETEKYAHVTYFFNGGREEPWPGEEHVLIPSPRIDSYADQPQMSAPEITKKVLDALASQQYHFILVNFANADMVGHTGNLKATQSALAVLDESLGKIIELVQHQNGICLITADHGNAEEVIKLKSGKIDKEHSANPVPLILVGSAWKGQSTVTHLNDLYLKTPIGVLADVAPTILKLFNIEKPVQMTGQSLI